MHASVIEVQGALVRALGDAGWHVVEPPDGDLVATKAKQKMVVELKVSTARPRLEALKHQFAAAVLMARRHAQDHGESEGVQTDPLAAVGASRLSSNMIEKLRAFADRYFGDVRWCIVDSAGVRAANGLDVQVSEEGAVRTRDATRAASTPFSDLGQWLIKVLLAGELDSRWIRCGGEKAHFRTARELAAFARVSESVVSVVLGELESRGFLQRRPTIQLVDRSRLFRDWSRAVHARPPVELAARGMFGSKSLISSVSSRLEEDRHCLGLFSACNELGVPFVSGAPDHLLVRRLDRQTLDGLQLVECGEEEANHIVVREAPFPESVFRGSPRSMPPTADVIQCWLDVVHHPVRGAEQATELWLEMGLNIEQP